MEEMLIEKVRSRVFLYDLKSPDYRDHEKRNNAWEEIGKELNIKPENAKDTWEKLRRCFVNALNRRRNKKSGEDAKKMPPWKYEEEMSFLLPSLDNRNNKSGEIFADPGTSKSINNNSVDGTNVSNGEILSNIKQERDENESLNVQSEIDVNSSSVSSKKRKREAGDNSITQMIKLMKGNSVTRQIRYDEKKSLSRDLDETEMFFLSLAKTTKTLPPIEQAKVKLLVSQTVLQAQIAIGEQAFRSPSVSPVSYISTHSEEASTSSHFATESV